MVKCAAKNCQNRSSQKTALQIHLEAEGKITFHRFPKKNQIRNIWLNNMGLTEAALPNEPFLCSVHFTEDAFDRTSVNRIQLRPGSFPMDHTMPKKKELNESTKPEVEGHINVSHELFELKKVSADSSEVEKKAVLPRKRLFVEETTTDLLEQHEATSSKLRRIEVLADLPKNTKETPCLLKISGDLMKKQQLEDSSPKEDAVEKVTNLDKEVPEASTSSYVEINTRGTSTTRSTSVSPEHFHSPTRPQYVDKATSVSPRLHFDSPRKRQLRDMLQEQSQTHAQEVKLLKQKCQRGEKRIASLQHVLSELRKKNLLQGQDIDVLENIGGSNKDLLKRLTKKSNNDPLPKTYSSQLRTFALTLHYYSPRAYEYVREKFDSCLPHPKTLSRWYRSINGDPGFNNEAFACIKKRARTVPYPLIGTLIFDEMSIRQHIEYDGKKFCGYTEMGKDIECEAQSVAKDALVFLFVCMNGAWKIPVGYFLINGMNAEQKSNFVLQCLQMLHEACVTVKCLTFDGAPVNIAMAKLLGCNLTDANFLQPWFPHPVTKELVYIFLDPCHMLKLIRNTLGDLKCITNGSGQYILWKFIQDLHKIQEREGLHLGNKLRQAHIDFHMRKMKVRFATQVFSKSVADALEVCENQLGLPQFVNCTATCKFLNIFNDLFDIFNSKNISAYGFKKAINQNNSVTIVQKLDEAKEYILGLKVADRKIVESRNKTGFIGFLMCIESLKALFRELCAEKNQLQYIPTYKISQDHLELFFGCIRARGGHNNNPTARQFKSAFKKILIHTELRETSNGNCLALESISILHVSSRINSAQIINSSTPATRMIEGTLDNHTNITDHNYIPDIRVLLQFSEKIIAYIAGFVVKQLKTILNCEVCVEVLSADHNCLQYGRHGLITQKNRGGLSYPSYDTFKICQLCEKVIRQALYESGGKFMKQVYTSDYLLTIVLYEMTYNKYIFNNLSEHSHEQMPLENHKLHLTRAIAQKYLKTRLCFIGQKCNSIAKSERHRFNKLVLFKGM